MSERAELIWYGDDAPWYDHGPQHPLRPARVILTRELIKAYGILDGRRVAETVARDATDEEIGLVHGERFIDATKRAGHGEPGPWGEFGYGPGDNPIFPNMHEAAARVAARHRLAAASRDGCALPLRRGCRLRRRHRLRCARWSTRCRRVRRRAEDPDAGTGSR